MKQIFTYLLLPLLVINASFEPQNVQPDYLISEITISCNSPGSEIRHFTDQASMQQILQYLRTAEFCDGGDNVPPGNIAPLYEITLAHSTGRITVYRQLDRHYLSKNNSQWHRLDAEQGQILSILYRSLPTHSQT